MASIKKPLNLQFRNRGPENLSSLNSSSDVLKFSAVSLVATAVLTACGPKADVTQESRPPLTILFPDLETQKLNGPPIAIYSFKKEEIPASQVDFLNKTYGGEPLSLDAWVAMKIGPVIETKNESGDGMVTFETYTLDNGKQIVAFPDKNENYSQGKSAEYFAGKFGDDEGIYYSYYIKDPADSSKIYSFITVRWDNQDESKRTLVENGANPNDVFGNPTTINVINPLTKEEISYVPLTGQNVFFDMIGKIIEPSGVVQAQGLPTNTPEPTAVPVPMIEVDGLQIPDPKTSNPELFDVTNPDSPIVQFANAFGVKPEEVGNLTPKLLTGVDGKQFVVLTTGDLAATANFDESSIPLLVAEQGENGEWVWNNADPGKIMAIFDKVASTTAAGGDKSSSSTEYNQKITLFNGLTPPAAFSELYMGQPGNPDNWLKLANSNGQRVFVHAAFGKYVPEGIRADEQYARQRMIEIFRALKRNNVKNPVIILSNEPFYNEYGRSQSGWNTQNPYYKDLGGNKWIENAYKILWEVSQSDEFKLQPGKDFSIVGINGLIPINNGNTNAVDSFYLDQAQEIRNNIAKQLGINPEELPFDLGLVYYIGDPAATIKNPVPLSDVSDPILTASQENDFIQQVQTRMKGSKLWLTEYAVNAKNGAPNQAENTLSSTITPLVKSINGLNLWMPLSIDHLGGDPTQYPQFFPNYIFGQYPNFDFTPAYYALMKAIYQGGK